MEDGEVADDGRRRRGDSTRRAVLARAVELASTHGLDGLSIGRLAADLSISKSGLFAHFGAKEELQLATIRAARRIYTDVVVAPALQVPPGLRRVWTLSEGWLAYSRDRVFPGGCFFSKATHEFAARPGPVLDALIDSNDKWLSLLRQTADDARLLGELDAATDVPQLVFALNGAFEAANVGSLLGDDGAYDRARAVIRQLLDHAAPAGFARPWET